LASTITKIEPPRSSQKTIEPPSFPGNVRANSRCHFTAEVAALEPHSQANLNSRTSDLSHGGCYVDTMSPFSPGMEINLRITKNNVSFHAKAKVTHSQPGVGMGLCFSEVAPAQRIILNRWLSEVGCEFPGGPRASVGDGPVAEVDQNHLAASALEDLLLLMSKKRLLTDDESAAILRRLNGL
jgi:hypothetical protein